MPESFITARNDVAWGMMQQQMKNGNGQPQYATLCSVMLGILVLCHSNADCERIFLFVTKTKTAFHAKCHDGCANCTGPAPDQCEACQLNYTLNGTHCDPTTSPPATTATTTPQECPANCAKCSAKEGCSECDTGFGLNGTHFCTTASDFIVTSTSLWLMRYSIINLASVHHRSSDFHSKLSSMFPTLLLRR
ncbi:hypothetical protein LSAT2_020360 [Lamellibrachia satsuma]|nr:hypothetical protein LSAT2_020360 [Lamellibrachia satsuma]